MTNKPTKTTSQFFEKDLCIIIINFSLFILVFYTLSLLSLVVLVHREKLISCLSNILQIVVASMLCGTAVTIFTFLGCVIIFSIIYIITLMGMLFMAKLGIDPTKQHKYS